MADFDLQGSFDNIVEKIFLTHEQIERIVTLQEDQSSTQFTKCKMNENCKF